MPSSPALPVATSMRSRFSGVTCSRPCCATCGWSPASTWPRSLRSWASARGPSGCSRTAACAGWRSGSGPTFQPHGGWGNEMTGDDGLHDEMRHQRPQPGFRSDPLALDEGTAERLLTGGLDPADAPPAYMRTAMVLEAIAAPPSSDELADEAAAVATLAAVARSSPHRAARRRPTVFTKVLSAKMAAAAAIAALSVAGVAGAATGTLPDPAQRVAHQVLGAAGVPAPDDHASDTHGSSQADHSPTGPDATGAAKAGLCRAWQAGQGADHGKKADAVAFKALAEAAGGSDKIADYCEDVTTAPKSDAASAATPSSTVPAQAQTPDTTDHGAGSGQGSDAGQGQGGSPSSTTPPIPSTPDPHN